MSRFIRVLTPTALAVGALALTGCGSKSPSTTAGSTVRPPITAAGSPTTKAGTPTTKAVPATTAARQIKATPECTSFRTFGATQNAVTVAPDAEKAAKYDAVVKQAADLSAKVPSLKADIDLIVKDVKDFSVDGKEYTDTAKDTHKTVQGRLNAWFNATCYA